MKCLAPGCFSAAAITAMATVPFGERGQCQERCRGGAPQDHSGEAGGWRLGAEMACVGRTHIRLRGDAALIDQGMTLGTCSVRAINISSDATEIKTIGLQITQSFHSPHCQISTNNSETRPLEGLKQKVKGDRSCLVPGCRGDGEEQGYWNLAAVGLNSTFTAH